MLKNNRKSVVAVPLQRTLLALGFAAALSNMTNMASAASVSFNGEFVLDYTSSIAGAPKGTTSSWFLTLNGSAQDNDHFGKENDWGGLSFAGFYPRGSNPVLDFRMALQPSSSPSGSTFDPSGLVYDFSRTTIITVDANAAVGSTEPFNEHLAIGIPVLTLDSPITSVTLNLYNSSSLFDPVSPGTRQLILDTSTGSNGFTLDDLFLNGLSSLAQFRSTRDRENGEPQGLVDPVYLNGPISEGTFGAGTITSVNVVPLPAGAWLLLSALGGLGFMGWRRKKAVAA